MRLVWFIRHAQSEANAGLPTGHDALPRLTPHGQLQAQYVAGAFTTAPDLIVTSPFLRTQQTAAPTLARFPNVPHTEWAVQEFTYLALGHDNPTTNLDRQPFVEAYWERGDPDYIDGPGVESFAEFIARVRETMRQVSERPEPFIAVFTHGFFMRALLWLFINPPALLTAQRMRRFRSFALGTRIPNTAILPLRLDDDGAKWLSGVSMAHLPGKDIT